MGGRVCGDRAAKLAVVETPTPYAYDEGGLMPSLCSLPLSGLEMGPGLELGPGFGFGELLVTASNWPRCQW